MLTLCPPPGKTRQMIVVLGASMLEKEVDAPALYKWNEEIEANEVRQLGFHIREELVRCDNGDRRSFAFQLVNPQITLI